MDVYLVVNVVGLNAKGVLEMNFIQFKELLEVPEFVVIDPTQLEGSYNDDDLFALLADEDEVTNSEDEDDEVESEVDQEPTSIQDMETVPLTTTVSNPISPEIPIEIPTSNSIESEQSVPTPESIEELTIPSEEVSK